jgi:WD40 repeat protein
VRLAAGGGKLAFTEGDGLAVVRADAFRHKKTAAPGEVHSLAFDPAGGLWLATGFRVEARSADLGVVVRWDNTLGDMLTGLGNVWGVSAGRRRVLAGGRDGCLRLLEAGTGTPLNNWKICTSPICGVALSAGEDLALVGTWKGDVRLLSLPSGEKIDLPGRHHDRVEAVAFLGRGFVASGASDRTLRLWRMGRTPTPWLTLRLPAEVKGLSASADGERLAVVVAGERAARILDVRKLQERMRRLGLE